MVQATEVRYRPRECGTDQGVVVDKAQTEIAAVLGGQGHLGHSGPGGSRYVIEGGHPWQGSFS